MCFQLPLTVFQSHLLPSETSNDPSFSDFQTMRKIFSNFVCFSESPNFNIFFFLKLCLQIAENVIRISLKILLTEFFFCHNFYSRSIVLELHHKVHFMCFWVLNDNKRIPQHHNTLTTTSKEP